MKRALILLLLSASICAYPLTVFSSLEYTVIRDKINARVDSTVTSEALGFLAIGDKVEVIKESFGWYKIKLPQKFSCYVAEEFTQKIENNKIRIIASNVNLRSGPSLESCIIGRAPKEAEFPSVKSNGHWIKIEGYPYAQGWVHKKFLKQIKITSEQLQAQKKLGLTLFIKKIIPELFEADIKKKKEIHSRIIEKGEE
ncbi:MAG: SH3 domain-containing protein, partial [Candidatus Omnitrophota bacterium]